MGLKDGKSFPGVGKPGMYYFSRGYDQHLTKTARGGKDLFWPTGWRIQSIFAGRHGRRQLHDGTSISCLPSPQQTRRQSEDAGAQLALSPFSVYCIRDASPWMGWCYPCSSLLPSVNPPWKFSHRQLTNVLGVSIQSG